MSRLTPEELRARKRQKAEEERAQRELQERAAAEQAEANERECRLLEERCARLSSSNGRHEQLGSVVNGLYEEVNKLTIKWPSMLATTLLVDKTNQSVSAVRQFIGESMKAALGYEDEFTESIEPIVPAGDQPENRDVLLTLRELRQALERAQLRLHGEADAIAAAERKMQKDEGEPVERRLRNSR
jgi:hypothetical protein